ncbi:uncharacterized protein LOC121914458 [Sceloporus undulatus]|uniref:uncharacterized protein LOC121914458 n=1 Tax=Sceloporus undulatus TaxID=8520 RepID=UPI001C4D68FB|nr:uncharacterized protein LOC121914458 [Sceloporus undulatus]
MLSLAFTYFRHLFAGSACDGGATGIRERLMKNLGEFCSVATLNELQAFYPDLDGMGSLASLSPAQAADLTLVAHMMHNSTLSSLALALAKGFEGYDFVREYLSRIGGQACQSSLLAEILSKCKGPSPLAALVPETQQKILDSVIFFLKKEGNSMDSSQWTEVYQLLLSGFLPAIGMSHIPNETCEIFCDRMKEITTLHPILSQRQEELPEVKRLCLLGDPRSNLTAGNIYQPHLYGNVSILEKSQGSPQHMPQLMVTTQETSLDVLQVIGQEASQCFSPEAQAMCLEVPQAISLEL